MTAIFNHKSQPDGMPITNPFDLSEELNNLYYAEKFNKSSEKINLDKFKR
jgi:hypothetical protein